MIGLLLVTHGDLAKEFIAAMQHVVGEQPAIRAVCIGPDDDMEQRRQDILDATDALDSGAGTIVLTDMFGGTPSNLAISILQRPNTEVIAGINLPLLIKLAGVREDHSLAEATRLAQEAGRKYITVASQLLSTDPPPP